MANNENIELLKQTLCMQKEGETFSMSYWGVTNPREAECGSIRCIGGWCNYLDNKQRVEQNPVILGTTEAARWLGIRLDVAEALFYPQPITGWGAITVDQAIGAIDVAIADGATPYKVYEYWASLGLPENEDCFWPDEDEELV